MIEGAAWRRWVFFRLPLLLFLVVLLFPFYWMLITTFRPDGELYRPWNAVNYNPFWTWKPTLTHIHYLFTETLFAKWLWNTMIIALVSTMISRLRRLRRLRAGASELPLRRQPRDRDLHHLSRAADVTLHPAVGDHPELQAR